MRALCVLLCLISRALPVAHGACVFAQLGGSVTPVVHSDMPPSLSPPGRRLQQSNSTCPLTLGSSTLEFAACRSLEPVISSDYNLLFTVTTPAGQPGPVLHGAIDAASTGWVGFGIPAQPGVMVGGSAIIVKACPSCPSGAAVDSYFLADYKSSAVRPPGKLKVLSMQAQATPTGRLQAYFEIVLPQTAASLRSSALDVIYALGELAGEELQAHEDSQGVPDTLSLATAFRAQPPNATTPTAPPSNSSATAPVAAASPAASSSPTMAPATVPPLAGMNASRGAGGVSIEGTPSTTAPTPAPASLAASNCLLQTTAAKSSSYSLCEDLPAGSGLKVYWSLDTAASPVLLSGALEGTTDGWLGFGFPAVPGEMIGGSAIIAKPCSACPTGASVDSYFLGGYDPSQVRAPGRLSVAQMNASLESGRLFAQFTMQLPQSAEQLASGVPIIAAQGSVSSSENLVQHAVPSGYVAQSLNFGSGTSTQQAAPSNHYSEVHGILMVTGFGILIPIGVLVARTLKPLDPLWFHLHRTIQALGLCLGLAGFGLGLHLGDQGGGQAEYDHKAIGYAVVAGGLVQLLFGVARAQKGSSWRLQWAWFHRLLGASIVILAAVNVFLGLHIGKPTGTHKFVAGYSALLAVILALAVLGTAVNEYRAHTMKKRPQQFLGLSQHASGSSAS
ncbi:hypothetical protein ABBQ32_004827 [Trebouxia sp. C0010 RCD-2024]